MSTLRQTLGGTAATLLDAAELGGLGSTDSVVSAALASTGIYDNRAGSTVTSSSGDGYEEGYLQFTPGANFGSAPVAGSAFLVYFLKSLDGGTTFEGGSATNPPSRLPDAILGPFNGTQTTVADCTLTAEVEDMGGYQFRTLLTNAATGQAIPSGSTLKYFPATDTGT